MIVIDTEWKSGLYDLDEKTEKVSKVLRCFHNNDTVTFDRFDYDNHGQYKVATEKQIEYWQCEYYLEDGTRPLKSNDCAICEFRETCNHNQKYYE